MAIEYFDPLTNVEQNNDTNFFIAGAAGIASGIIKVPEGVVSLAADLIDLGFGTDLAAEVEKTFDKWNPFEEIADDRAIGKLAEAIVQIGVPGTIGFKLASGAMKAKKAGKYLNLKNPNVTRAVTKADQLNKRAGMKRFAAGVTGGAVGETFVADVEEIGSFGDIFGGPTALDNDESDTVRGDALRRLMNRVKFGSESILLTPIVYGVGRGAKAVATQGERLAYSNSKFFRGVDKFAGAFRPRRNLPQKVFDSQAYKESLKSSDIHRADELVKNIDININKMFPWSQSMLDKATKKEKREVLSTLKELLFKGNVRGPLNPELSDKAIKFMKRKGLDKEARGEVLDSIKGARSEFARLLDLTKVNSKPGTIMKENVKNMEEIMGERIEEYIANTYRIYEDKGPSLFFRRYEPGEEAYNKVVNIFRRHSRMKDPKGKGLNLQESRMIVNNILDEVPKRKPKGGELPSFKYPELTQGSDAKELTKTFARTVKGGRYFKDLGDKTPTVIGKGSKAFRELFGEIDDPRYSVFNGITNLSAIARTNQYLLDIATKNDALLKAGKPAWFYPTKAAAEKATNYVADVVELNKVTGPMTKNGNLINPLADMWTTKEIASSIENINNLNGFFAGAVRGVRGREEATLPEQAVSWGYRNLLLYPKGISQISKTVLSIPTHIRNFLSAGAFAGANGIFFSNPALLRNAFKNAFGTIQVGRRGIDANKAYRELLELGVVNQQVQIGDLKNLLRDVKFGETIANTDDVLSPMLSKLKRGVKKTGKFFQDAYVAEDDFWKITNYAVELDRLTKAYAKAGIKRAPRSLKEEAANIVRNTVPNYAYVGDVVKTARILPIGNFMSFPSEVIRTTTNIAEQGIKEMAHSKPTRFGTKLAPVVYETGKGWVKNDNIMYGTGAKRLSGMATTLAVVPQVAVEGGKALYNITEDELQALRRFLPDWSKNSTIIPLRDDETGELKYIDFSHSNAYDVVSRPFTTLLRNIQEGTDDERTLLSGFVQGVDQASGELMNPFISESIFTEAMLDVTLRGGRTAEGRQLYTDQTSWGDKQKIKFLHVGEALAPSYKQYDRLIRASLEVPGGRGEQYELDDEIAGFMGFRPIKVNPLDTMGFKIADYQTGIRNARREFTGGAFGVLSGGKVSPNEVIERYIASNKARFNVQKEMYKNIDAAQLLGADVAELRNEFRDRQISPRTYNKLGNAEFIPYFPSIDIQKRFREIAEDIGAPNPFEESRDTLQELYQEFRDFSLLDEFDLNVGDYLFEDLNLAPNIGAGTQSTLQTPGVNPALMSQVLPSTDTMQTGLTPTEQALLSNEEKAIKLRQRGMTT